MQGKKGNLMIFVNEDEERNLLGEVSAMIDGKKYKEDTPYQLEDGKIVEVELNEEQQQKILKAKEALKLTENIDEFYS